VSRSILPDREKTMLLSGSILPEGKKKNVYPEIYFSKAKNLCLSASILPK
jgi:hypothetical protein